MKLATAGMVIVLLALGILIPGCGSFYSAPAAAEWEARKAVEGRLKSPGSAKFETTKIAASAEEEGLYVVYLVVDSQNEFGAVLRSHALALVMAGKTMDDESQVLHLEVTEDCPSVARIRELTREMGRDWSLEEWLTS